MRKRFLSLLLAAVMLLPAAVMTAGADNSGSVAAFNGHSYMRCDEGMSWTEAKAYCELRGGYLVCITSEEEQAFVERLIADGTKNHYWIGAYRDGNGFSWVTGEPFSYTHWDIGDPNNYGGHEDAVHILRLPSPTSSTSKAMRWNDATANDVTASTEDFFSHTKTGFIIEFDSESDMRTSFGSEASAWALPEMEKALELGLVPDALKGENLTRPITRAEFAAVAVKTYEALSGTKAIPIVNNSFTDCSDVEVLKAYGIGAVAGTSATTFSPDQLLNREQAAAMLTRVFKRITLAGWTLETDSQFTLPYTMPAPFAADGDISGWARDSVYFMAANGIINGTSGNRFAPKNVTSAQEAEGYANATREQALAIAVRMVENLK